MIIYVSTFMQPSNKQIFEAANKNYNPYSAHNLSYAIFEGLSNQINSDGLKVINIPPIGFWPRLSTLKNVPETEEIVNGIEIKSIGYKNLYLYQYRSIYVNLYKKLCKLSSQEDIIFLVYSLNIPVITSIERYRKKVNKKAKIVIIIPDFIEDVYSGSSIKSIIKRKIMGNPTGIYNSANGYVLLTEQMTEKTGSCKPYCIVEGVYNETEKREKKQDNDGVFKIFYSGMLFEKFGVKMLVESFCRLANPKIKLQLCGCGDLESYIKEKSAIDSRIEYLGMLPRDEVLALQCEASLLVNPRQPTGEFTKFSFPSKTIEYMASGTPLLMYRLPGVPEEYYDYCFSIDNDNLEETDLYEELSRIIGLTPEKLKNLGKKARDYVIENKNSITQCSKIIALINSL